MRHASFLTSRSTRCSALRAAPITTTCHSRAAGHCGWRAAAPAAAAAVSAAEPSRPPPGAPLRHATVPHGSGAPHRAAACATVAPNERPSITDGSPRAAATNASPPRAVRNAAQCVSGGGGGRRVAAAPPPPPSGAESAARGHAGSCANLRRRRESGGRSMGRSTVAVRAVRRRRRVTRGVARFERERRGLDAGTRDAGTRDAGTRDANV